MDSAVHRLKPGSLGLVAHTMKPYELNGWIKRVSIDKTKWYTNDLVFCGQLYFLNAHVPHGTLVLVLSEQDLKRTTDTTTESYYEVLWGETKLFVKKETLLNPYFRNEESS
jgi:hypothetical protein